MNKEIKAPRYKVGDRVLTNGGGYDDVEDERSERPRRLRGQGKEGCEALDHYQNQHQGSLNLGLMKVIAVLNIVSASLAATAFVVDIVLQSYGWAFIQFILFAANITAAVLLA